MTRKIVGWALLAFLAYLLVTNPTGAAHTVQHLGHGVSHVAGALAAFAGALGGGR